MNIILLSIIFVILALILFNCFKKTNYIENLKNLTPGQWPQSSYGGIVDDFYDWNNPTNLSSFNYSRQSTAYPIFSANSSINNNLEFWPTPPNGTCAFPELCNNFYKVLDCNKQKKNNNEDIIIWPQCALSRVNLWCSKQ